MGNWGVDEGGSVSSPLSIFQALFFFVVELIFASRTEAFTKRDFSRILILIQYPALSRVP
jgi:hypothetical protein